MRTYDFSPLWRSTIGFDRLFDLVETAQRAGEDNYPPYNIERLGRTASQIASASAASFLLRLT
jgi:molecular chaperone IbpA